jgi:hypothetical protein
MKGFIYFLMSFMGNSVGAKGCLVFVRCFSHNFCFLFSKLRTDFLLPYWPRSNCRTDGKLRNTNKILGRKLMKTYAYIGD